jgi:phenylalanyl-tRNA synthetase beta chain
MRAPLKWLNDYVDLNLPDKELAHRLTMAGLEVTSIERTGESWNDIFVGHVLEVERHPNADRLTLVTVDVAGEKYKVVCGAPNVAAGQNIAYARIGAQLIDGHSGKPTKLKKAKIRGVESAGMVCSEKELGLSDQHEGILVLGEDAPNGLPLTEYLGDSILDIDMKPNRADGLSILGIARDVAALTGGTVREPDLEFAATGAPAEEKIKVEIQDPDLCSRYTAVLIEGIEIGPSPPWMQEKLIGAGMRPISNVVDITNFVMLELGQPIHAFDYDTIKEHTIIVRRATPEEKLTTLDGVTHTFGPEHLLITDPNGPVAVAGVMGGLETEVTEKTKNILLEVANFNQVNIRRTAMALKAQSEASKRFAWGLPPELTTIASRRCTKLLVELAGGTASEGIVDAYPVKAEKVEVELELRRLKQVLGIDVSPKKVVEILGSLGFSVKEESSDRFRVGVPYWRRDVRIPDDLAEEIARIVGYDEIPIEPIVGSVPPKVPQPRRELKERVLDILSSAGMQEVITYPLTDPETLGKVMPIESLEQLPPLAVVNPLNVGQERLRTSLRAAMLDCVAGNQRLQSEAFAVFEISRVYIPGEDLLPIELEHVVGAVTGRRTDRWGNATSEEVDFYDAKSYVARLFDRLDLEVEYIAAEEYGMIPGRTAELRVGEKRVGVIGQVHPRTSGEFGIEQEVYLFEIVLDDLLALLEPVRRYSPLSRYPSVEEDLAVVVEAELPAERVRTDILGHPLVVSVRLFDEYVGAPVPEGKKSLAFSVSYQAKDRTLTDKDINKARNRIVGRLRKEMGAELRS